MAKRQKGFEDASTISTLPGVSVSVEKPRRAGHEGHRERLRTRFLTGGADALPDYELLEVLLWQAIPRRDTKPIAKALLEAFGSYAEVLAAPPERLRQVDGIGEAAVVALKSVQAAAQRMLQAGIKGTDVLSSFQALLDYCKARMAFGAIEQFRILFLDRKNKLIADEAQAEGTVDHTPVYPREVVKRALEHSASALIIVHNHPSGDPTPSRADIDMTRKIKDACATVGITLHDHVVIGRGGHVSFKTQGLL